MTTASGTTGAGTGTGSAFLPFSQYRKQDKAQNTQKNKTGNDRWHKNLPSDMHY
jgi:hypothetical protein